MLSVSVNQNIREGHLSSWPQKALSKKLTTSKFNSFLLFLAVLQHPFSRHDQEQLSGEHKTVLKRLILTLKCLLYLISLLAAIDS